MPRQKRDMVRVNTYLKKSHYSAAKKLAEIDGNTAADQIRMALNFYITDRIDKLHKMRNKPAPTKIAMETAIAMDETLPPSNDKPVTH